MCARININMDDPSQYEKTFVVLEPGDYTFTITNRLKLEKSKTSENQICKIELSTELEDGTVAKVFDNLVQGEKSQWKWYQFFRACGFDDNAIKEGIDLDDLLQMTVRAKIKQEMYNGEPQARVSRYLYEGSAAE